MVLDPTGNTNRKAWIVPHDQSECRTCHWSLAPGKLSDSRHSLGKWNDDRCPVNRITGALGGHSGNCLFVNQDHGLCLGNVNYVKSIIGEWIELEHWIINLPQDSELLKVVIENCRIWIHRSWGMHITMQCYLILQCYMVNVVVADRWVYFATLTLHSV